MRIKRFLDGPIISSKTHSSVGPNITGSSLIQVPSWIETPLGKYYLYFADHKGGHIRLAYADKLTGPWNIYSPGTLQLEDSFFLSEPIVLSEEMRKKIKSRFKNIKTHRTSDIVKEMTTPHIASPDVHVDYKKQKIVMYYHGLEEIARQVTRVALSDDGLAFAAMPEVLGQFYFRVFHWQSTTYAMSMPGQFYRSQNGLTGFEEGPLLFNPNMRHAALLIRGTQLYVFWTQVGEAPERILLSTIDLTPDWSMWKESEPVEVFRPERDWEGANAPLEPSLRGAVYEHVNELRDPAIFKEDDKIFLLYSVAGEAGIAIAQVIFDEESNT